MARAKFERMSMLSASLVGAAFARAVTVEQINTNRGKGQLQRFSEVRNVDEGARTVEVAFSSETPVERWFGDEILDHSPGAMDMSRLLNGAAVLWNHNHDVQIGVVETPTVDADRRGRAVLRFGNSARAEEIWKDVLSGVIRHISVGYFVRKITSVEEDGKPDQVTITAWEPFEISFVSVPADASVGVGRGLGDPPEDAGTLSPNTGDQLSRRAAQIETEGTGDMKFKIMRNAAGDLVRCEVDDNGVVVREAEVLERASVTASIGTDAAAAAQTRVTSLLELGAQYGAADLAADAIRGGETVEAFTRRLVDHVASENSALNSRNADIGLTDAEVQQFSFLRAVNAMMNPNDRNAQEAAAFEFEASRAAEQTSGRVAQGVMVPVDVLTRALNTSSDGLAPGNTGGVFVDTTLMTQSFIQLLRNRSVFMQMATPLGGLVGNYDIPGQASGGNVFWVGEDEDVGEGGYEARTVSMSPKTLGVFGEVTRRMAMQSSMDVEAQFRGSLARDLGLGVDTAGFYGTGGANMPLGVFMHTGINAVPFAALQPTNLELIAMETEVAADNADAASMAYIGNSRFRGHAKSTQKFAGSNGMTVWEDGNTVNGTRTEITNQIALGDVLYGNFADANVGMWGGLDILVDPYTKGKSGTRRVIMHQDVDFSVNNVESFCVGRQPA